MPLDIIGVFQVDFGVRANQVIFHSTEDVHGSLAYWLFGLIGERVLVALWHHVMRREQVLLRMWPRRHRDSRGSN